MKQLFIAIEGIDGSGKSSIVNKLREYFKARNCSVSVSQQPSRVRPFDGGNKLEWLKDCRDMALNDSVGLSNCDVFITDRWYPSNLYQYVAGEYSAEEIKESINGDSRKPDYIFVIESNVYDCLRRMSCRGEVDFLGYETTLLEKYDTLQDLYTEYALGSQKIIPHFDGTEVRLICGSGTLQDVFDRIRFSLETSYDCKPTSTMDKIFQMLGMPKFLKG